MPKRSWWELGLGMYHVSLGEREKGGGRKLISYALHRRRTWNRASTPANKKPNTEPDMECLKKRSSSHKS